jgi:hypothetical protein
MIHEREGNFVSKNERFSDWQSRIQNHIAFVYLNSQWTKLLKYFKKTEWANEHASLAKLKFYYLATAY